MGDRDYATGLEMSSWKRCPQTTAAMHFMSLLSQPSFTAFHYDNKIIQKAQRISLRLWSGFKQTQVPMPFTGSL